jgi:hypothetical protein
MTLGPISGSDWGKNRKEYQCVLIFSEHQKEQ